ncbi:isoaspartyl peptidase/L-asparaginase [Rhizobiales bacterium TNE-4]|nr:isoaspartyl peptidase/L-asparaginase [Rhizobiales bacterium TNE-4]MBV1827498.1 isoaspartyl peptidase/L-asparaginase [Rhizobiales bacterium TNE-4]
MSSAPIALALHGGCGTLPPDELTPAEWAESRDHLAEALRAGWDVLKRGGRSLDAVEATVVVLENSPHFNAGHGAALNAAHEHELDSAIMDGATLSAGAVAGAQRIRNPVKAARALLERNEAILLIGPAADRFAEEAGLVVVENSYFTTPRRIDMLRRMKAHKASGTAASEGEKHGTVGAVACDRHGHLAAATSTGGYTNKPPGRVGDSPLIGAGTYARDGVCAVSCTGMGEYFMRAVAGHEIAAQMSLAGRSLDEATQAMVFDVIGKQGIGAGLCAVDAAGHVVVPFNTVGMYRGFVNADGDCYVGTHADLEFRGTWDRN